MFTFINGVLTLRKPMDEATDGAGDKGASGSDNNGSSDNGSSKQEQDNGVTLSQEEYQKFKKLTSTKDDNDGAGGIFQTLKDKDKSAEERKAAENEIRENVLFDREFDGFLAKNKNLFSIDAAKIREHAKNLEGKELTDQLVRTSAKDFFSKPENLKLLPESDQEYVKNNVCQVHEKFIDPKKSWELIQAAVHVNNRLSTHESYKQTKNAEGSGTPNLDNYLERVKLRGQGKTEKAS